MLIEITPSLAIDENEIQLDFIRSSGPGGQNVNKVATSVQQAPFSGSMSTLVQLTASDNPKKICLLLKNFLINTQMIYCVKIYQ